MGLISDALNLQGGGVVSLIGAGGKTTLMFLLAQELAAEGESVLTTTTTKIFVPRPDQSGTLILAEDFPTLLEKLGAPVSGGFHVTAAASQLPGGNKLAGYPPELIDALKGACCFKWILVEADGSRQLPLKAPAEHEPVIPETSGCVIAVVGLEAIGKPLCDEYVFRSSVYSRLTGIAVGSPVTAQSVVRALLAPEGIFKGSPPQSRRVVFLNKAEDPDRLAAGEAVARSFLERGSGKIHRIFIGSLLPEPRIVKRYALAFTD
ncbi:MAG: selenium cofactor biosynthesis protein YqeC [Deltaproteobacteria bacterium]|jgi:probable selenium-dependent hydroxylase accessory protein YqeC|nr:selenium cofactor biosynthesis protein YqeC [Deltaproteobacteria bacterium]